MEIAFVILGVLVFAAVFAYTHHSRAGQRIVSQHRVNAEAAPPGASGPAEVDRDRGEYPQHGRGTR